MSLATLPSELYYAILSHVPLPYLQLATLNLSRSIPFAPVPLRPLFQHIVITRLQQVPQLYQRLRCPPAAVERSGYGCANNERSWINSLTLATWQVDPDALINLLALLPQLQCLSLKIGTLFSPEHLQEMFLRPDFSLCQLSLRFRPYVQVAKYYQFLKGSYFDSILESIARWPSNSPLTHLSIIQDPLPCRPVHHTQSFAQPIVFFSLAPLTILSLSPSTQLVTHLRLRVPSRQLAQFIATSRAPGSTSHLPNLTFLDLSTSSVSKFDELEGLINHVGGGQLRHVVLDNTGLCKGNDGEWVQLGRTCALVGVKRMREREKALKAWTEARAEAQNHPQGNENVDGPAIPTERRPRRGRRGLATATISLRESPTQGVSGLSTALPTLQTAEASSTTKIRVIPPLPRLLSLSTSLPLKGHHRVAVEARATDEARARSDFTRGWFEGVNQLRDIWARLRQSQSNGIRVVRFCPEHNYDVEDMDMTVGLTDMGKPGIDEYWDKLQDICPPALCFAGPRGEEWTGTGADEWPNHPDGCGHRVAWAAWQDNL